MKPTEKEKAISNYYRRLNRFRKLFRALSDLPDSYFITITQNTKRRKNRNDLMKFLNNIRKGIKSGNSPYLYVIETHKTGEYHGHMITSEKGAGHFMRNYTAGFTYVEEIKGNIYNEMVKYLTKKTNGTRSYYANKIARAIKTEYHRKIKERERTGEIA